ncbi:MAG: transporter, family, oxalate/formate antiporter [Paraburkholderia sp.]|nr:transporter, family, oxalate/formate antiporter [Paraburkholderia sp.]
MLHMIRPYDCSVLGLAALPLALTVDRVANGLTRPMFGWVSDCIGRENTMFVAFGLEALAMTAWLMLRHHPVLFVVLSGWSFSVGAKSSRCFRRR